MSGGSSSAQQALEVDDYVWMPGRQVGRITGIVGDGFVFCADVLSGASLQAPVSLVSIVTLHDVAEFAYDLRRLICRTGGGSYLQEFGEVLPSTIVLFNDWMARGDVGIGCLPELPWLVGLFYAIAYAKELDPRTMDVLYAVIFLEARK